MNTVDITGQTAILTNPDAPVAAKIAAAAALWDAIERAEEALKPFKDTMRTLAVAEGKPSVTFNGEGLSQCKVVVPGPSLRLNDGITVEAARADLGPLFDLVYEVKLNLRSQSPAVVSTYPAAAQVHLATVTSIVPSTPRVSLKVLPGVEEIR
jgi:hypothetical protein